MAFDDGIYSIPQYVQSGCDLVAKVAKIDALISVFEDNLLVIALDPTASITDEYQMDDGQMKVRTKFRAMSDVQNAIGVLETMKQRYLARLNGRVSVLRSGKF